MTLCILKTIIIIIIVIYKNGKEDWTSIVLKQNFKKSMSILLPIAKKVIRNQLNKIKSRAMRKKKPNEVQNTFKRVSNRGIKRNIKE